MSFRTSKALLLLVVWFWIWGICPWDESSSMAQSLTQTRAPHGHQEADHPHHASKGGEHSCSASTLYSNLQMRADRPHSPAEGPPSSDTVIGDLASSIGSESRLRPADPFMRRAVLPKLLTDYYQLYSNYRI